VADLVPGALPALAPRDRATARRAGLARALHRGRYLGPPDPSRQPLRSARAAPERRVWTDRPLPTSPTAARS
jgi:hypothetical protein